MIRLFTCAALIRFAGARRVILDSKHPNSLDWSTEDNPRKEPIVTRAGFQGGVCNSCYVWAAVGSLESRAAIALDATLRALSVQQALDCARAGHMSEIGKGKIVYRSSRGCQTGFPEPIMQYALDEGFMLEEQYPILYDAEESFSRDKKDEECLVDPEKVAVRPNGKVRKIIARGDRSIWVEKVKEALAQGPVAVGIDKSSYQVGLDQDVRSAKVANKACPTQNNDHAVLLVGYGEEDDTPYWIIRNSWGRTWGYHGYFKVPMGSNFCGVETAATFLEISK